MDQIPPETKMDLAFLPITLHREFAVKWQNCLRTRSYGLEHRMDFGRALNEMRRFLQTYDKDEVESHFGAVCEALEITTDAARKRIALAMSWDAIRDHIDQHGLAIRMPATEYHLEMMMMLDFDRRGAAWAQYYQEAVTQQRSITGSHIKAWIENLLALPMDSESVGPSEDITFEDDIPTTGSGEDVPDGTKPAQAVEVTAGSGPLTQTPGKGPLFEQPKEVLESIEHIVKTCSRGNPEHEANWRRILSDPVKIKFEMILQWAKESDENIFKIARLIHGDFNKGLKEALRIVKRVVDDRTPISYLKGFCNAEGGRWEHTDGSFRIVVTRLKDTL